MNTRKTGQGMMTISVILGMVMLTWYFSGVEERQRNPNADPQSMLSTNTIEVPLRQNRQGHYLVNGFINGREVEFLLDTGATDVVIPDALARELNLPYGQPMQAMTMISWRNCRLPMMRPCSSSGIPRFTFRM